MLLLTAACDNNYTYSSYPCYLVIENGIHMDATLASAMNSLSPGVFCLVTNDDAKKQFTFRSNYGLSSSVTYNEKDNYRTRALGMNGALIVGFATLTGEFCAYDRECPVCYDPEAIPARSKPVSMGEDGMATCTVCHRQWNMNTGGNCISEGGISGLTRYRCGTTGPYGTLSVGN